MCHESLLEVWSCSSPDLPRSQPLVEILGPKCARWCHWSQNAALTLSLLQRHLIATWRSCLNEKFSKFDMIDLRKKLRLQQTDSKTSATDPNKKCNFQAQKPICTTSQLRSCWSSASSTGSFQNNLWDRKSWDSVWTRVQIFVWCPYRGCVQGMILIIPNRLWLLKWSQMEVSDLDGLIKVHEPVARTCKSSERLWHPSNFLASSNPSRRRRFSFLRATACHHGCTIALQSCWKALRWELGCQSSSFSHASPQWKEWPPLHKPNWTVARRSETKFCAFIITRITWHVSYVSENFCSSEVHC